MALAYKNWQRPGAIINLTVSEANNAKLRTDGIIASAVHKTSYTHGPAVMVLKGDDALAFRIYRRWRNANHKDLDTFFVTLEGTKLTNYQSLIKTYLRKLVLHHLQLPTITDVRKLGATEVAGEADEATMEMLAEHMSHKKETSVQY